MSSRADKAQKQIREKHQAILTELLREDANRFCADCESKGPRWSSWNIGVFLCIRCAGIHRNLGVHISKVKSVNLDSWTQEQIEHIQKWGNKRGKEFYECYLPDDFQRPHGDSAMEQFIRNKYERKLYKKKDGEPPPNKSTHKEQKTVTKSTKPEDSQGNQTILSMADPAGHHQQTPPKQQRAKQPSTAIPRPHGTGATPVPVSAPVSTPASVPPQTSGTAIGDLLSLGDSTVTSPPVSKPAEAPSENALSLFDVIVTPTTTQSNNNLGIDMSPHMTRSSSDSLLMGEPEKTMSTKESILSLYQSSNQNQQQKVYNVPGGMYMTQQPPRPGPYQGFTPMQNMQPAPQPGMRLPQQNTPSPRMGSGIGGLQHPAQMHYQHVAAPMNQLNMQMHQLHMSHSLPSLHQAGYGSSVAQPPQPQVRPAQTGGNFSGLVGNEFGAGPGWNAAPPMIRNQQPIAVNGPTMGFGSIPVGNMQGPGHTMSTQLWK